MTFNIILIILMILIVHWIADFVLQTDRQAKNKCRNMLALTEHIITYSVCWFLFAFFVFQDYKKALIFFTITFITHWLIDFFTSRLNNKLWNKGDSHNFFVSIGFDQLLHYSQLIITYYLLI